MAPSSIEHLSVYLVHKALDSSPKISNSIPWKICFAIVGYALSLDNQDGSCQNGVMMDIIRHLEATSTEFAAAEQNSLEYLQKEKEIHDILVDTFIPQAQEYFNIPTSDITSLALFIFILLYSLPNPTPKHVPFKIYWVFPVIMKELKFQLEVLGDMKLHSNSHNHPGDGEDFLNEFQDVANAAGNFIYYCVFPSYPPLDITWFCVCSHILFYKFHLLNENIKNHGAAQFSKFPDISGNPWSASTDILNSLSELKSLLALLEDLMNNSCFHFVLELNNQAKKLYGKLRSMQSFLKAVIADLPQQQKEIDGLKECVIPIRNVTAEAQFLITSFAKDQFPVWYMTLRLCNVITKFEIVGKAFIEIIEKVDEQVLVDCDPTEPSQDMQEKKIQTPTTRPSITHLSKYLTGRHSREQLTWLVTQQPDQSLPWKGLSCLAIVCYALKVSSDSKQDIALMDAIRGLNDIASEYEADHVQKERQIAEIFAKSFMPNAKNIFTLQMSSFPGSNVEHLAGFIHFLLQILNSEADHTQNKDLYIYLQKELTFLFAILGDVPFQHIELESIQTILKEFETAVNEAATFIFSCAFTTLPVSIPWFCVSIHVMIHKFHLLNENIKDHCIRFSKLPEVPISPKNTTAAVDSLFIVESLIADLENMMDSSLHLIIEVKDQIEQLQDKLVSVQPFLMLHDREIEGVREHIIQIKDAAYEAEYLINSFVSEDVPTWYVTLRLPNIIPKFDVLVGVAELKKVDGIQVKEVLEDSIVMGDNIFMGYENEATQILGELTGGSDTLRTILILGMPGIGKTTLAKKLYDDGMVTHYFDECAWSVVSQTYQKRKALTDILMSLRSMLDKETVLKMEDDSLISSIYKILKGKRYLIVIDDVWNSDVWNDLRRYFPNDRTGSRILLTSRIRDVTPTDSIVHTLSLLSEDQCWELLEKKVFGEGQCPKQLVNSGKEIAAKCNGLPLLVVIIAGVLANIGKENTVWKKVEKSLDSYMSDCMRILELSYEHLPDRLKLCFLYLGIFPEDTEIQVRKLTWLWIAEGFIPKEEWKSPEDVANEYLNCLIDRSLVMVTRNKSTGGVKACSIHDLLRDMCLIKAREENFLILVKNESFSNYEKQQRLCVHSTDLAYLRPFSLHCRSFFGYLSDPSSCIPQMKHVRAMELPRNIEDAGLFYKLRKLDLLVRLRYLIVDRLPESILSNLLNLEYLRIDSLSDEVCLPSAILKMVKLRHLHVRNRLQFEQCAITQTNNLETLSFFNIYHPKAYEILKFSPHLRKLKCMCIFLLIDFRFLKKLESLRVGIKGIFRMTGNSTGICLPSSIKKLTLFGILLPWERMSVLGRLPNLQVLKLLKDAFVGEQWETSDDEFQKLKYLKFQELQLKEWIACGEHFPKLQHLVFNRCEKLQKLPSELGVVQTLQMIEVHGCSEEASISALEIEEEQYDYGNEEIKVIITNDRWSKQQLLSKYREEQEQDNPEQKGGI